MKCPKCGAEAYEDMFEDISKDEYIIRCFQCKSKLKIIVEDETQ